ncbi:hypothetical protein RYX36_028406, partial [Vicia faba]
MLALIKNDFEKKLLHLKIIANNMKMVAANQEPNLLALWSFHAEHTKCMRQLQVPLMTLTLLKPEHLHKLSHQTLDLIIGTPDSEQRSLTLGTKMSLTIEHYLLYVTLCIVSSCR